jgi:hypothetical protein
MARLTNIAQLMKAQDKQFRKMSGSAFRLHEAMVDLHHGDFIELTSGKVSKKTLEKTRPFALRSINHGSKARQVQKGSLPRLPINKHTGRLQRSWRKDLKRRTPMGQTFWGYATAPYAKYVLAIEGTRLMVARGLFGRGPRDGEMNKRGAARSRALTKTLRDQQRNLQ